MFPELVGKWYTKTPLFSSDAPTAATPNSTTACTVQCTTDDPLEENSCEKWCYCQTKEWGTMIDEGCAIQWFHIGFTLIA